MGECILSSRHSPNRLAMGATWKRTFGKGSGLYYCCKSSIIVGRVGYEVNRTVFEYKIIIELILL